MNDFTKEELELIAECVESDFYKTNWSRSLYEPLITKIQCLIDNYCEHEWIEYSNDFAAMPYCKKCRAAG